MLPKVQGIARIIITGMMIEEETITMTIPREEDIPQIEVVVNSTKDPR